MKWVMVLLVFALMITPVMALDITSIRSWYEDNELQTFVKIHNPEQEDLTVSVYVVNNGWYLKRSIEADDTTSSVFLIDYYDNYEEDLWVRVRVRDEEGNSKTKYRPVFR